MIPSWKCNATDNSMPPASERFARCSTIYIYSVKATLYLISMSQNVFTYSNGRSKNFPGLRINVFYREWFAAIQQCGNFFSESKWLHDSKMRHDVWKSCICSDIPEWSLCLFPGLDSKRQQRNFLLIATLCFYTKCCGFSLSASNVIHISRYLWLTWDRWTPSSSLWAPKSKQLAWQSCCATVRVSEHLCLGSRPWLHQTSAKWWPTHPPTSAATRQASGVSSRLRSGLTSSARRSPWPQIIVALEPCLSPSNLLETLCGTIGLVCDLCNSRLVPQRQAAAENVVRQPSTSAEESGLGAPPGYLPCCALLERFLFRMAHHRLASDTTALATWTVQQDTCWNKTSISGRLLFILCCGFVSAGARPKRWYNFSYLKAKKTKENGECMSLCNTHNN